MGSTSERLKKAGRVAVGAATCTVLLMLISLRYQNVVISALVLVGSLATLAAGFALFQAISADKEAPKPRK